jgi:hypothetical protein
MRGLTIPLTMIAFACVFAADQKLTLKDLAPAVQKTVEANLNGAEIKNINKEAEKGDEAPQHRDSRRPIPRTRTRTGFASPAGGCSLSRRTLHRFARPRSGSPAQTVAT